MPVTFQSGRGKPPARAITVLLGVARKTAFSPPSSKVPITCNGGGGGGGGGMGWRAIIAGAATIGVGAGGAGGGGATIGTEKALPGMSSSSATTAAAGLRREAEGTVVDLLPALLLNPPATARAAGSTNATLVAELGTTIRTTTSTAITARSQASRFNFTVRLRPSAADRRPGKQRSRSARRHRASGCLPSKSSFPETSLPAPSRAGQPASRAASDMAP